MELEKERAELKRLIELNKELAEAKQQELSIIHDFIDQNKNRNRDIDKMHAEAMAEIDKNHAERMKFVKDMNKPWRLIMMVLAGLNLALLIYNLIRLFLK